MRTNSYTKSPGNFNRPMARGGRMGYYGVPQMGHGRGVYATQWRSSEDTSEDAGEFKMVVSKKKHITYQSKQQKRAPRYEPVTKGEAALYSGEKEALNTRHSKNFLNQALKEFRGFPALIEMVKAEVIRLKLWKIANNSNKDIMMRTVVNDSKSSKADVKSEASKSPKNKENNLMIIMSKIVEANTKLKDIVLNLLDKYKTQNKIMNFILFANRNDDTVPELEDFENKTISQFEVSDFSSISVGTVCKFIEITMQLSLHELYTDEELRNELKSIHKADGYAPIHWAIWSRIFTDPDMNEFGSGFKRTEEDVINTVQLCLDTGSTPLDVNSREKAETAIGCLLALMRIDENKNKKRKRMTEKTFNIVYNKLIHLENPNVIETVCIQIINKFPYAKRVEMKSNVTNQSFTVEKKRVDEHNAKREADIRNNVDKVCWVTITQCTILCKVILFNLLQSAVTSRDRGTFLYSSVQGMIGNICEALSMYKPRNVMNAQDSVGDFDLFFTNTKTLNSVTITGHYLVEYFKSTMRKECYVMNLDKSTTQLTNEKLNSDIIGAVLGEVSPAMDVKWCLDTYDKYPSAVWAYLLHFKEKNKKAQLDNKITDMLMKTKKETREKFIIFQIDHIFGLYGKESNSSTCEVKKNEPVVKTESEPDDDDGYMFGSVEHLDRMNCLAKIKDEKVTVNEKDTDTCTTNLTPVWADEVQYSLFCHCEKMDKENKEKFLETIIMYSIDDETPLTTKGHLQALKTILGTLNLTSYIVRILETRREYIREMKGYKQFVEVFSSKSSAETNSKPIPNQISTSLITAPKNEDENEDADVEDDAAFRKWGMNQCRST
jgi:hypothetical protein